MKMIGTQALSKFMKEPKSKYSGKSLNLNMIIVGILQRFRFKH